VRGKASIARFSRAAPMLGQRQFSRGAPARPPTEESYHGYQLTFSIIKPDAQSVNPGPAPSSPSSKKLASALSHPSVSDDAGSGTSSSTAYTPSVLSLAKLCVLVLFPEPISCAGSGSDERNQERTVTYMGCNESPAIDRRALCCRTQSPQGHIRAVHRRKTPSNRFTTGRQRTSPREIASPSFYSRFLSSLVG